MMFIVPYHSHEGGEERGLGEEEGQITVQGVRRNVAMHRPLRTDTYFVARISQPIRGQVSVTNCKTGPALSLLIIANSLTPNVEKKCVSRQHYLGWSNEDSKQQLYTDRIIPSPVFWFLILLSFISLIFWLLSVGGFEEIAKWKGYWECGGEEVEDYGEAVTLQDPGEDGGHHRLAKPRPRLGDTARQAQLLAEVHLNHLQQQVGNETS